MRPPDLLLHGAEPVRTVRASPTEGTSILARFVLVFVHVVSAFSRTASRSGDGPDTWLPDEICRHSADASQDPLRSPWLVRRRSCHCRRLAARAADDDLRDRGLLLLLAQLTALRALASQPPVAGSTASAVRGGGRHAAVGEAGRAHGDVDRRPAIGGHPGPRTLDRRGGGRWIGRGRNALDPVWRAHGARAHRRNRRLDVVLGKSPSTHTDVGAAAKGFSASSVAVYARAVFGVTVNR
jgi:hypothetical protein